MNRVTFPASLCAMALFVAVASCGDASQDSEVTETPAASAPSEFPAAVETSADASAAPRLVDPNHATREQLLSVEGLNGTVVDVLVAGRPYSDMLAVDGVLAQHLSETERETVYRSLWRPLDLNSASAEEILLIPGVGERMQHEFEEYRPYRAMAEFRREIGKYVDEEEVARLEQYVAIR